MSYLIRSFMIIGMSLVFISQSMIGIASFETEVMQSPYQVKNDAHRDVLPRPQRLTGNITLETYEETAQVGPGDNGRVTFNGSVTVELMDPLAIGILVELSAQAEGLKCTVSPNKITIDSQETDRPYYFKVIAEVPLFTSSNENFKLTVSGTARPLPGAQSYPLVPDDGRIRVAQYFGVIVESSNNLTVERSGTEEMRITLKNMGNGGDQVRIEVRNKKELAEKGITIEPEEGWLNMSEGGQVETVIRISVDENTPGGQERIDMIVISNLYSEQDFIAGKSFLLRIKGDNGIFSGKNWVIFILGGLVMVSISGAIIHIAKRRKR